MMRTVPSCILITSRSDGTAYWRMCWEYRELLWFLARRDLVVRYRQTVAGVLWLLVRPFVQVLTFSIVFGVLAGLPSDGLPYPLVAFSGVAAWMFFAAVVDHSTIALVNNQNLITKVHFPRILLPIGTVVPNCIDLTLNLAACLALMLVYGYHPSWRVLLLPVAVALVAVNALGLGFWFSAGSVRYRDFRQLCPFVIQTLFLLSPVGYSTSVVKDRFSDLWLTVFYCNPLAAGIDLFRWCLLPAGYAPHQDLGRLIVSLVAGLVLLASGQAYFRRAERTFADVI